MQKTKWLSFLGGLMALAAIIGPLLAPSLAVQEALAQEPGTNLLRNGDFEEGGIGQAWPFQDGIPEVQVAPGWRAFWLDNPPPYAVIPSNCVGKDTGCYWARPEFRGLMAADFAYRVHGGQLSQKYFTFGRQHEAGLYQQVSGITPGVRLRFSVYLETWSCLAEGAWNNCPTAPNSNKPAPMHTKVGIDPTGGTNPWASTVVWSQEVETYDHWTNFWVEATAEADTVTVFIYSRPDWVDGWPRINNDVYVDDAALVVVGDVQPTPAPPPPTSAVPPTPRATSTPRPDGAVVHVVQPGDTLYGIAYEYGVDPDQIRQLNAGSIGPNDLLVVGQELVISVGAMNLPTPTPIPTEATPGTPPPATQAPEEATQQPPAGGDTATLCVLAYEDRNGDMVWGESDEPLLSNATITLVGAAGEVATYTTDGLSEPHCFQNLQPGNYVVRQEPPAGYVPSGGDNWGVLLGAGQSYTLQLGYRRSEGASSTPAPAATEQQEQQEQAQSSKSLLTTILQVSGILALVLALAVAGLFILSRRQG